MRHFRGLTSGFKEKKLNSSRRAEFLSDGVTASSGDYRDAATRGMTLCAAAGSLGQLLLLGAMAALLLIGPRFGAVSSEGLTGFVLALLYLNTPLVTVVNVVPQLGRAGVALLSINALGLAVEARGSSVEAGEPADLPFRNLSEWRTLQPRDVAYAYRDELDRSFRLGPLSGSFESGEVVADEALKRLQLDHAVQIEERRASSTNLSRDQQKRLALFSLVSEQRPIHLLG